MNAQRYKGIACWNENYCWLIEKLSTLDELPLSPPLRIPEIVSWKNGAPKFILRYDGKRVLKLCGKSMNKEFVHLNFCSYSKDSFERKVYRHPEVLRKETSLQIRNADALGLPLKDENHKAVLRLRGESNQEDSGVRFISDKVFNDIIAKWNTGELKKISLMQEFVRLRTGTPYTIVVQFFAVLPAHNRHANIDYSQSYVTGEEDGVERRIVMCKELCRLICWHLAAKADVEVLEMRVEFLTSKTECWLNNATNVIWRKKKNSSKSNDEALKEASRLRIVRIFSRIEDNEKLKKDTTKIKGLEKLMCSHVESMKEGIGLTKLMAPESVDPTTDNIFKQLKPGCPYKYTEMMDPSPIIYKSDSLLLW